MRTFWTDPSAASFHARLAWKHLNKDSKYGITLYCPTPHVLTLSHLSFNLFERVVRTGFGNKKNLAYLLHSPQESGGLGRVDFCSSLKLECRLLLEELGSIDLIPLSLTSPFLLRLLARVE